MKNKLYEGQKLNNFKELVALYKSKYSENIAFEYKRNHDDTEHVKISYAKFAEDIENLGTALLKSNSKRICIIADNRYEWFVSYLAITTAGLCVVPLDKSLPNNEIISLIERSEADGIFYSKSYEDTINSYKKSHTDFNTFGFDNGDFDKLLASGKKLSPSNYDKVKIKDDEMYIMIFTSGTTSTSKAVMHSQYAICMDLYALSQMIEIKESDKFLSFLPLHHTFENTTTFLFGTSCGYTVAICEGLKYIQKNLVEYKITGFVCVPLMLEIMYKKILTTVEKQGKTKLVNTMRKVFRHFPIWVKRLVFKSIIDGLGGKLKIIISGGAAMDEETLQGYNDFGFDIHQGYGLTETAPVIAGENSFEKRVGSIGFPLPTVDIKIDKPDKDGVGEIITKTPTIMLGYYKNEKATNEAIVDGWFHTGDYGYIDDDNFVFVTGRKKDMIVLKNGKKVFPEEVETLINKLPYVTESMVFGYIDNNKQSRNQDVVLYAKVVYDEDKIKEVFPFDKADKTNKLDFYSEKISKDIKTNINKQMPAYKYIRKIMITDVPLIKTTTQKIKRNEEMKLINKELG